MHSCQKSYFWCILYKYSFRRLFKNIAWYVCIHVLLPSLPSSAWSIPVTNQDIYMIDPPLCMTLPRPIFSGSPTKCSHMAEPIPCHWFNIVLLAAQSVKLEGGFIGVCVFWKKTVQKRTGITCREKRSCSLIGWFHSLRHLTRASLTNCRAIV